LRPTFILPKLSAPMGYSASTLVVEAGALVGVLIVWACGLLVSNASVMGAFLPFSSLPVLAIEGCFVGGLLVVVASMSSWRERLFGAALLVCGWLLTAFALRVAVGEITTLPSVSTSVGGAAYFGTPYVGAQIGILFAVVAITVTAAIVALVRVRPPVYGGREPRDAGAKVSSSGRSTLWIAAGTLLIAGIFVPRFGSAVLDPLRGVTPSWDAQNLIGWEWAVAQGLVPMKDFFYPYGLNSAFDLFPSGAWLQWLVKLATLGLIAWSVAQLSDRHSRVARSLAAVATVAVLAAWNDSTWRYSVAFALVAAYAAAGPMQPSRRASMWGLLLVATVGCGLYGLDSLGSAAVGCVAVAGGELISRRAPLSWHTAVRAAMDVSIGVAALGIVAATWVLQGSFAGNARFWLDPGGVSAYSAGDQQHFGALMGGIDLIPTLPALLTGATSMLLVAGLLLAFQSGKAAASASALLLGGSGLSLVVLMKHLVRPQFDAVALIPLLALALAVIILCSRRSIGVLVACGIFAGSLGAAVHAGDGFTRLAQSAAGVPKRVIDSVGMTGNGPALVRADRNRFDPAVYPGWTVEPALARAVRDSEGRRKGSFAVVGEAPAVYFLLGQRFPYHNNLYNASQASEQKVMVDRLARQRPQRILWRRDSFVDGVPLTVRVPIVMTYTIANYVPMARYTQVRPSTFDILRPRRQGERVLTRWWAGRLGRSQDLGFVPAASRALSAPQCRLTKRSCASFLELTGGARSKGSVIAVNVRSASGNFVATFRALEGTRRYALRLDRLWFWPYIGKNPHFEVNDPGWQVQLKGLKTNDLY